MNTKYSHRRQQYRGRKTFMDRGWSGHNSFISFSPRLSRSVSPSLARFKPGIPTAFRCWNVAPPFPNFKNERNFHDSVVKFNYFSRIIFEKSKFYKVPTRVLEIVIFNFKSNIQRFTILLSISYYKLHNSIYWKIKF